jgi:phage recombination protein Bet
MKIVKLNAYRKGEHMGVAIRENNKTGHWLDKKRETLRNTICRGCNDDEVDLFIHACQTTGLDPFMKQIHAIKRFSGGREVMTIQTSIDGFRVVAERTGKYAPGPETVYEYGSDGQIISATAYIKKYTQDGMWHIISATAYWDEYCQRTKEGKPTHFWVKMPRVMLGKCAESLALRKAFPAELSGLYSDEEMIQATTVEHEGVGAVNDPQLIEDAKKYEVDLLNQLYEKVKDLTPSKDKLEEYVNSCVEISKKSKREYLLKSLEDTERFCQFFERWIAK